MSWVMVLVRQQFLRTHFESALCSRYSRDRAHVGPVPQAPPASAQFRERTLLQRVARWFGHSNAGIPQTGGSNTISLKQGTLKERGGNFQTGMIRRIGKPVRVDPMGFISGEGTEMVEEKCNQDREPVDENQEHHNGSSASQSFSDDEL